jgi:DNA-binding NtrC family response regulator
MLGNILLVDDEVQLTALMGRILRGAGFEVAAAHDGASAREAAVRFYPDAVVLDIMLPDTDGVSLMRELRGLLPHAQFIMMTAHASIRTAVEATRLGALEYLTKPVEPDELVVALKNAMRARTLADEVRRLRTRPPDHPEPVDLDPDRFPSPAMRRIARDLHRAAETDAGVLLTGGSGTGKNHLAAWIHRRSRRADGPFFDVNCASIASSLVESELFGHEPGAFTGSRGRKRGLLELAHGGTLLLDEIGDMELPLQAKLLAFLDTHTLRRLGAEKTIEVDARVIAATNQDLERLVEAGRFRQDLFYRLNVLSIEVPSLRDRTEDLPIIAERILARLAHEMDLRVVPTLAPEALADLAAHDWPGNVRELRNLLERALLEADGAAVVRRVRIPRRAAAAPRSVPPPPPAPSGEPVDFNRAVDDYKRTLIVEALRRFRARGDAAEWLGLSRHSLHHHMKRLGIEDR